MNIEFENNNPNLTVNNKVLKKYFNECGLFKYSYEEILLDKYLYENFYVRGIFYKSENIQNNPTIHRKEKGSKKIYGQQIVMELKKVFGFNMELIESRIKHWLEYQGFDKNEIKKLWEVPLESNLSWISINAQQSYEHVIERIRREIFASVQIPSILINPDNV